MDKTTQVEILRREHSIAVGKFDFERAEMIDQQIKTLKNRMAREWESSDLDLRSLDLDGRRERILGTSAQATASLMDQRIEKQRTFHQRYQALQARHTQELTDLSLQHTMELERELARPIPEVEALRRESTIYGHQRKYAQARAAFEQAKQLKEAVIAERQAEVNARYLRRERQMKVNHDKELSLLGEKQQSAMGTINKRYTEHEHRRTNQLKAQELKESLTRRAVPSARRSRSVTRSQASCRPE
jgi:hypothetical protein